MDFIWHDGGRAACGFVGSAGDCVTRSLAIASGEVYRDVYDQVRACSPQTPRKGVHRVFYTDLLLQRGWVERLAVPQFDPTTLPRGVVLVEFHAEDTRRCSHLSCLVEHTVYDTWNPFEDPEYHVYCYWIRPSSATDTTLPAKGPSRRGKSDESQLTQNEYERILKRVKALHRTATNHASTDGEIQNALRAMQALMLTHNLKRSDIVEDEKATGMGMTRRACPLNHAKACAWETALAHYLVREIFPTVQFYRQRRQHRTLFWFYGPVDDVEQILELFREMLLTIATAARIKYRGHTRGSGASYAEGYVAGLPRKEVATPPSSAQVTEHSLMHTRTLAVHSAARDWLARECGIHLQQGTGTRRNYFDPGAHQAGRHDGSQHHPVRPNDKRKISYRPD